jgi:hypothetical protein
MSARDRHHAAELAIRAGRNESDPAIDVTTATAHQMQVTMTFPVELG